MSALAWFLVATPTALALVVLGIALAVASSRPRPRLGWQRRALQDLRDQEAFERDRRPRPQVDNRAAQGPAGTPGWSSTEPLSVSDVLRGRV